MNYNILACRQGITTIFSIYDIFAGDGLTVNISALGGSAAQRLEALNDAIMNLWDEIKDISALTMEFGAALRPSVWKPSMMRL